MEHEGNAHRNVRRTLHLTVALAALGGVWFGATYDSAHPSASREALFVVLMAVAAAFTIAIGALVVRLGRAAS